MKKIDPEKKIILDADVIIHFCKGACLGILPQIFPNKLFVPDIVYQEALSRKYKQEISNLIAFKFAYALEIKSDINVLIEYNRLHNKLKFGKGESACMAYCKYNHDVVGSSNLKDIKTYCNENGIVYLTTMDFIEAALETEKMTEAECDHFIYNVKSQGGKLPYNTIREFIENN